MDKETGVIKGLLKVNDVKTTYNMDFLIHLLKESGVERRTLNWTASGAEALVGWNGAVYKIHVETVKDEE